MAAALSVIHRRLSAEDQTYLGYTGLRPAVHAHLKDVGFFGGSNPDSAHLVAPLKLFAREQSIDFTRYTQDHIANKGLPLMSERVTERVFQGIDEIFQNFVIHSSSSLGAYACGQLDQGSGWLEFTLADHGDGIPRVVARAGFKLGPSQSIDWAMTGTNTTRSLDIPGGLGLKMLRSFVKLNGGKLTIASGRGFWSESESGVEMKDLEYPFPGTVVTIAVDTRDESEYLLEDEIDPASVF